LLGRYVFKKESMGGGDVKLGAMIGAFLGPQVIVVLFLSFFLAFPVILIGFGTRRISMGSTLPFGPFISLSAAIVVLYGELLYYKYFQLIGIL
jgi:prepilin signal peptidase PulO-like enzyme (type II secretory pathway)